MPVLKVETLFGFKCVVQFNYNTLRYNLIAKSIWLMVFLSMGSGYVPNTTTLYLHRYIRNRNRWSCGLYLQAFHERHHKLKSRSVFIQIQGNLSQRHPRKRQQQSLGKWEILMRLLDKMSPTDSTIKSILYFVQPNWWWNAAVNAAQHFAIHTMTNTFIAGLLNRRWVHGIDE